MSHEQEDATIIPFPTSPSFRESQMSASPKLRDALGEVLRDERHAQDLTLFEVADDASVSLPYLSEVERGRKEVSSDLLESICIALDIEVADVLERAAQRLRFQSSRGPHMLMAA